MSTTQEYSSVNNRKSRKQGRGFSESAATGSETGISPDLAKATFEALRPFIDVFDCGIKWNGSPIHMITKEKRRLMERYRWMLRSDEKPTIYYESDPWKLFHPKHYFSGELRAKHIAEMLEGERSYYYTSGRAKFALPYLDLDVHHEDQTLEDSRKAVEAFREILKGAGFHRPSGRGDNIYIKVSYSGHSVDETNETFRRFDRLAKRYIEHLGLNVDVEVKGTITTPQKSGSLAKLPIGTYQGSSWTWELLKDFRSRPTIDLKALVLFMDRWEDLLDNCEEPAIEVERPRDARSARLPAESGGEADRLASEEEIRHYDDIRDEPNALKRQHAVLIEYCRRMGRVVSVGEALEYIKANGFYTPPWDNPARANRVRDILRFIGQTFDPEKCNSSDEGKPEIKVGKYDNWARHHLGEVRTPAKLGIDEYGRPRTVKAAVRADHRDFSEFLSVFEFCAVIDPNEDTSIPEKRAKAVWPAKYRAWNPLRWRLCRDILERLGVIKITDRNWRPGKAMRYTPGNGFDRLNLWWKREKKPSQFDAVPLEEFLCKQHTSRTVHNSYEIRGDQDVPHFRPSALLFVRPPP